MKLPESLRGMKFLLVPILLIPLATLVIATTPRRAEITRESPQEAARGDAIVAHAFDPKVVAAYHTETLTVELKDLRSVACDNMFKVSRYHPEEAWKVAVFIHHDDGDYQSYSCWREFKDFETAWDGRHYQQPIIAMCPLIDGIKKYDGCINVYRDRFGSK